MDNASDDAEPDGERTPATPSSSATDARSDPPYLLQRSGEPVYDAQDLARIVGVPTAVLADWEQSVGVPRPRWKPDGQGGAVARYSDRDVGAALWLRDQVRAGV
ncbi:MAG TPA: MerR family transcriptional regulator, partial [Ktedonobacterales bacterium]